MPNEQLSRVHDRELLEEATRLLRQLSFSALHGAHADGRYVTVSVDPRWHDDHERIWVGIACYAFGHRQVPWKGLPVLVLPADGEHGAWMAFLNTSGNVVVSHLAPGSFRLSTSAQYGCSPAPVALPTRRPGLAAAGVSTHTATRARGGRGGMLASALPVYESIDGRVRATVFPTHTGHAAAAFETDDETLAGAWVHFAFVQASGQVEYRAQVELTPARWSRKLWEGQWEEEVDLCEPCILVFTVLSPEG